ncbi:MAG: phosphotransferase [Deltaproteobacteria bacterium]|nr:phosphotransferase [Deltaproteobacteria bacterium]
MPGEFPAIEQILERALPGAALTRVSRFGSDRAIEGDLTSKAAGYGEPLRLFVRTKDGQDRCLVLHTATTDVFGHDRRADRAASMLLSFDRFATIPRHVKAIDVGAFDRNGHSATSLRESAEFYLLTEYAEGHTYADELRLAVARGEIKADDERHVEALARLAAVIHAKKISDPKRYRRSIRDLVGSGEGIFGMVDGYGPNVPGAPPERLARIETKAERWRFVLREKEHRLARTHGDFHPFNILFDGDQISLLDSSRGSMGDPADDVTCLSINYIFFAVEHRALWDNVMRPLWARFWDTYLGLTGDRELLDVCAPFLAWRGLVVANPVWYPAVDAASRDRVLSFVEATLEVDHFDPKLAEDVFS